ncbi:MAG: CAP domain-containing protein [Peptostreptococcaceae bacterium]
MNKKLKTLLSLGVVSVITASTMLPVNALSKTTYKKCTTTVSTANTSKLYIVINGVKYTLPTSPGCEIVPSIPTSPDCTPDNSETTPDNSGDTNDSGSTSKPETTPDNSGDTNDSGSTSKPETTPDNSGDSNNSGSNSKPETTPDNSGDNNNSNSTNQDFSAYQKEVLNLVNAERAKQGLSALTLDSQLSNVATIKSQDMINKNYFDHNSPTYGSPFDMMKQFGISYKSAGENIAMGQKTPQEVVNAWMNSKGHRDNILNANFTNLGVGVAKDSSGTIYWTQMFIGK